MATEKIKPLVSILIPAFKHEYFEFSLRSALEQTYRPIEVIVGDDSGGNEIFDICKRHHDIIYFKNATPSLATNIENLIRKSRGTAIKFLLDDDLLHPSCVEKMVGVLNNFPQVSIVSSHCGIIDKHNEKIGTKGIESFKGVNNESNFDGNIRSKKNIHLMIKGDVATKISLKTIKNIFGELSVYMFRKKHIDELAEVGQSNCENFGKFYIPGLRDVTLALKLCQKGDFYLIQKELSYFRKHENSSSGQRGEIFKNSLIAWKPLLDGAYYQNIIPQQTYHAGLRKLLMLFRHNVYEFPELKEHIRDIEEIINTSEASKY